MRVLGVNRISMKVTLIEKTDTVAVFRLDPGWIDRLLGKKSTRLVLERTSQPGTRAGTVILSGWRCRGSNRPLDELPYAVKIANALDFSPADS